MTYVLSDIHGNERRFESVLKQICLQPEDTLYVLGDVIDRHPGGIRILRRIMPTPNAQMLLGNHEYMMLRALGCPYDDYADDGRALEHRYRLRQRLPGRGPRQPLRTPGLPAAGGWQGVLFSGRKNCQKNPVPVVIYVSLC